MNTRSRSKFKFLMTIGMMFAILASVGASSVAQADMSATSVNKGLPLDSTSQDALDEGLDEKLNKSMFLAIPFCFHSVA